MINKTEYSSSFRDSVSESEKLHEISGYLGSPEIGLNLQIQGDEKTIEYFLNVALMSWSNVEIGDKKKISITTHRRRVSDLEIMSYVKDASLITGDIDNIAYLEKDKVAVLLSKTGGWMNVCDKSGKDPRYEFFGNEVELGLTSAVRVMLLKNLSQESLIFHASAMELKGVGGVVFSTPDMGIEDTEHRMYGKTTGVLAVCVGNQDAAMYANDELIIPKCNDMKPAMFPNEITIRNWLLKYLFERQVSTSNYFGSDEVTYFTAKGLADNGVRLASDISPIKKWFFMDLNADINSETTISKLDPELAWTMYSNSLFLSRMSVIDSSMEFGEQGSTPIPSSLIDSDNLRQGFFKLLQEGCEFFSVSGGVNPENVKNRISQGCYGT